MGVDFNVKPVGASVATPYVAPATDAAKKAVTTQLPPQQAVTASDASSAGQNNPQPDSDRLSRQVVVDRAAGEIVFRVVDSLTSVVVRQFPDDARLRARAYVRAQDVAKLDHALSSTDLRI